MSSPYTFVAKFRLKERVKLISNNDVERWGTIVEVRFGDHGFTEYAVVHHGHHPLNNGKNYAICSEDYLTLANKPT